MMRDGLVRVGNGNEWCGETDVHSTYQNCNGHVDVVKALIEAGSNINQGSNVSTHMQCHCNTFIHVLISSDRVSL